MDRSISFIFMVAYKKASFLQAFEGSHLSCNSIGISIIWPLKQVCMGCQDELLLESICEIYEKLSRLDNFNPSEYVNSLFTQLVLLCVSPSQIEVTKLTQRVQEIRGKLIKLCGHAEGLLESHFSTLIGAHEKPLDHIRLFPYYSNYLKLSQLEVSMLREYCTKTPMHIAFVGSGPLPLTSIILASNHLTATCFHNYDIDPLANSKALQLVSPDPNLSKRMVFHTTNIMNVSRSLKEYEVIFLAALVGMHEEEKVQVINHLAEHMAPGAFLLLRSAHGARAFLYPIVNPSNLQGFEVLSVFHPADEVINSVIIARKRLKLFHEVDQGLVSTLPSTNTKCCDIREVDPINHRKIVDKLTVHKQQS